MKPFMKKVLFFLVVAASLFSCKNESKTDKKETQNKGAEIIKKATQKAGSDKFETASVQFVFRGKLFKSSRNCGQYELQRIMVDEAGDTIVDQLNNIGITRRRAGKKESLSDTLAEKLKEQVNSVHYFVELPFGLNDQMVHKNLLDSTTLNQKEYDRVEVTFNSDDEEIHQDRYLYWVNKKTATIDYLGYEYETDGKGMRFRVAKNPREVNGIRFVDYENYAPKDEANTKLEDLGKLYAQKKLKKVSDIEISAIQVEVMKRNCN